MPYPHGAFGRVNRMTVLHLFLGDVHLVHRHRLSGPKTGRAGSQGERSLRHKPMEGAVVLQDSSYPAPSWKEGVPKPQFQPKCKNFQNSSYVFSNVSAEYVIKYEDEVEPALKERVYKKN